MQRQHTFRRGNIGFHQRGLVRGQSVEHQMYWLRTTPHHSAQQPDKRLGVQPALIGAIPEPTPSVHRGGRTDRLPLARAFDHGRLTLLTPGLAMHAIGTKARLIPEIHLTA